MSVNGKGRGPKIPTVPSAPDAAALPDPVAAFHRLYYDAMPTTWMNTFWFGVSAQKCPFDLWVYQEILYETRPDLIIETGTASGGSALFMAMVLDQLGSGAIWSVDVADLPDRPSHSRITYRHASSVADDAIAEARQLAAAAERVMVILDSDHRRDHVTRELELYHELVSPGCYLIVEDTNLNGNPVRSDFGPGPTEALQVFLAGEPDFEVDRRRENLMLTFNPGGFLRRRTT